VALTNGSYNSQSQFSAQGTFVPLGGSGSTVGGFTQTFNQAVQENLLYGTSTQQCNLIVLQNRPLALSSSEVLDLYGATTPLTDISGATCQFRHIRFIHAWIVSGGDTTGLTVGTGAGSHPWVGAWGGTSPTQTVYPGGVAFAMGEPTGVSAMAVGATSGQLQITNNSLSAAVLYGLAIAGTTT
jgi:hypothetical protein